MARKKAAAPAPLVRRVSPDAMMAFIECHSEGHTWRRIKGSVDPVDAEPGMRPPWGSSGAVGRRAHCDSCGCNRVRWYTRSGEVVNRYSYADGYLHKRSDPDDVAPSRLEWRKTLVTTLFHDDLGKQQVAS